MLRSSKLVVNHLDATSNLKMYRTLTSAEWSPVFDGLSAGVVLAAQGMHVVTVWPDAETEIATLPWDAMEPFFNPRTLRGDYLGFVDELCVVPSGAKLNRQCRERKSAIMTAILELPKLVHIRVRLARVVRPPDTGTQPSDGRELALDAARFAYASKLQALWAAQQQWHFRLLECPPTARE